MALRHPKVHALPPPSASSLPPPSDDANLELRTNLNLGYLLTSSSSSSSGVDETVVVRRHLPPSFSSQENSAPDSTSAPHSLLKLLDKGGKGFISKIDVLNALFSVGIEPSSTEMMEVFESLTTQSKLSSEVAVRSIAALLERHGVEYDKLKADLTFWRTFNVLSRSDDFVWIKSGKQYFWKRCLQVALGFPAYFYPMVPKFTTYEKGVYGITKNVIGGGTAAMFVLVLSVVLMRATNRLKFVDYSEILACYSIVSMAWAAQAAREAAMWTSAGRKLKDKWMFWIRALRFYYCSSPDLLKSGESLPLRTSSGVSCLHIVLSMLEGAGQLQTVITQLSQQGSREQTLKEDLAAAEGRGQERRLSIIHDDFLQFRGDSRGTSDDIHSRFNIFQFSANTAVPQLVALASSALPTIFRSVKGMPCIGSASYGTWDSAATVILFLDFFLGVEFTFLVPVGDALSELNTTHLLSSYVCDLIDPSPDPDLNVKQPFELRLDNAADVECFEMIVMFCTAFHDLCASMHVAAFECLGVISLSSAVLVFLVSLLDFQIKIYAVLIFVLGAILLVPLAIVLSRLCTTHDLLTTTLMRRLLTQHRLNEELINADFNVDNEQDRAQLLSANVRIKIFVDTIAESRAPVLLLGILPLKHENVNRIVVSISLVLFSTLLRQSLKL